VELTPRVLESIRSRQLLAGGETVLVAVSGGADSVALLLVLGDLRAVLGIVLLVGHVHHGLRPEADRDAELVGRLCARLGVPFHLERVAVDRKGTSRGDEPWSGVEAEARRVRYAAFRRLAAATGAARVATAHTADDQAETVLMRLLQGAGPRGLAGIPPIRDLFIRPLIDVRRTEIEADLRRRGEPWVEDAMNRDARFLRARIRHDLLPFLETRFEPRLVARLGRSADLTRALVADLDRRAAEVLDGAARSTAAGLVLPVATLAGLSPELAAETVRLAAMRAGAPPSLRAPSFRAIARAIDPAIHATRARLGRLALERSGRWLRVGPRGLPALGEHVWAVPGCLALPALGARLEARVFPRPPGYAPPGDPLHVAFDAARMPSVLAVRARRAGDRFTPFDAPTSRRLKSFLVAAGIPRWERDRIPIVEAGGEIAWVVGLRRGRMAPVMPDTRRILEVTVHGPVAAAGAPE
jgi:tRNA(Ile)-lysidine synthase